MNSDSPVPGSGASNTAPATPKGGGGSSSLDPSETTLTTLPDQTRPQREIHGQYAADRFAVWSAFATSREPALEKRATRIERCCQLPSIRLTDDGQPIVAPQRCRDRLCPLCSHRRAREAGERMTVAARQMNAARMLTLTAPHLRIPLAEQLAALRAAFASLRRSDGWRRHVTGGLYAFEVTYNPTTGEYHPHIHALIDGEYWDWRDVREAWRLALNHRGSPWSIEPGDPLSTRIELIRDRRRAAAYVAKYITKPAAVTRWPPERIAELALALAGGRLLHTFGNLHGAKLDPRDPNAEGGPTTHVAGIHWLNAAARAGQVTAQNALVLFRCVFPRLAAWSRRDRDTVPDGTIHEGESVQQALARLAAAAEREWWAHLERTHAGEASDPNPPPVRVAARRMAQRELWE